MFTGLAKRESKELTCKLYVREKAFDAAFARALPMGRKDYPPMKDIIADADLVLGWFLIANSDLPENPMTEESKIKSIAEELRNSIPAFLAAAYERMGGGDDLNDSCPDKEEA